jgi:hypothetical protein
MPYANPEMRAECARRACRRYYHRRYHKKQLARAARYREANRALVAKRQRTYMRRKLASDPTYPLKRSLQQDCARRCRQADVRREPPVSHFKANLDRFGIRRQTTTGYR